MKLARINVASDEIKFEEISKESKYYLLGARGLTSRIINAEVPPKCDPLSKENKLIIANGVLTGSPFPNSARTSIGAKSPLTNGIKESNVGGRPSLMMAWHGIRALILEGLGSNLKIIIIDDAGVRFDSGSEYKGMGNYELHSKLIARFGKRCGIYSIGPAGEYQLKNSTIAANDIEGYPGRHAGRGGLGAVMGSKCIKAIVIVPSKERKVKIHDLKAFRKHSVPFAKMLAETKATFSTFGTAMGMSPMSGYGGLPTKNFRLGSYDDVEMISGEKLHEIIIARGGKKRLPCSPTCVIKCSNLYVDEKGNHITSSLEYEKIALNGSNLMINELDAIAKIDHLCDDIGLDTIEFGGTIGVAMDEGKIEWGDSERVFEIMDEIRKGSEIGQLYGNGVLHIGNGLNARLVPQIMGQGISGYDPRVFKGMGATFVTTPMGADHTAGAAISGRSARADKDYGALTEDKGKLDLSFELQLYTVILDSMGCCYFIGPSYENMDLIANVINAMHGTSINRDDLIDIGKSILRDEIEFNKNAGISQELKIPKYFMDNPSSPTGLTFTLDKDEVAAFWRRLDS